MIITKDSTLEQVAFTVCTTLHEIGVTAVLTGGSAATIWSRESYQSRDCDFIINFYKHDSPAEEALKELGYTESGGTYRHSVNYFTLDFPPGPLSIGDEYIISWETLKRRQSLLHILTPTDSCRDRLAAYYHWNDFSSFEVALSIAQQNDLDMEIIRQWSKNEDSLVKYAQFERALTLRNQKT